jgi:site-specific DNA recombinase
MDVAIYTRISSDRSGDELGVARQEKECREHASKRGLRVVAVETDNDVSAFSNQRRPGWESLLSRVRSREIEGIVVWHTDRLYRRLVDLDVLTTLVRTQSLTIYTVRSGEIDLSSPAGILLAEIMGAFAGHEVRHKSERQVAASKQLAESGSWSGNRVPLGYRRHPTDKHMLEIHPGEAEVLREARRRVLGGYGVQDTTRWAKAELLAQGNERKTLTPTNFRNLLLSPTNAGFRLYVPKSERDAWNQRRKDRQKRPGDFTYRAEHLFKAKWEPIFSDEEWKSISSFLSRPDRVNPGRAPKALLSGILFCYLCGSVLGYSRTRGAAPSYKCSNDSLACPGIGVSAKPIEDLIQEVVQDVIARSPGFVVGDPKIKPLAEFDELDKLKARKSKLIDLFEDDLITRSELETRLGGLAQKMAEIASADGRRHEQNAQDAELNDSLSRWGSLDTVERRFVIKGLMKRVTILPTKRIWGRAFQPLRVVLWWADGDEPSLEEPLRALLAAEERQLDSIAARKAAADQRRLSRPNGGSLK